MTDTIGEKKIRKNRTKGTAFEILRLMKRLSLSELLSNIYVQTEDPFALELIKKYESQLILAHEHPDSFIRNLHTFYVNMAHYIKKQRGYRTFLSFCYFIFTSLSSRQKQEFPDDIKYNDALNCYYDILLQQINYFTHHPKVLYGLRSDDRLLLKEEPYPYLDVAMMEMMESRESNTIDNALKYMRRHGLSIYTKEDFVRFHANDQLITNMILIMAPLLNEHTEQINTHRYYPVAEGICFLQPVMDTHYYKKWLRKKQFFLPINGLRATYMNSADIDEVYYQEVWVDNRIILLFKVTTKQGDFSGFYDNAIEFFFSPWENSKNGIHFHELIENFILENYCLLTIEPETLFQMPEWKYRIYQQETIPSLPIKKIPTVTFYLPSKGTASKENTTHYRVFDRSQLQSITKSIAPFIRQLPSGAKASEEAIERAKQYHYILREGETFVRPFKKRTYRRQE